MKHKLNALEEMIKKDVDGGELDAVEHVIFWVWDDETGESIEAAEKAAELYAALRARAERAEAERDALKESTSESVRLLNLAREYITNTDVLHQIRWYLGETDIPYHPMPEDMKP